MSDFKPLRMFVSACSKTKVSNDREEWAWPEDEIMWAMVYLGEY